MQRIPVCTAEKTQTDGIFHDFVRRGNSGAGTCYFVAVAFNFSNETLICLFWQPVI